MTALMMAARGGHTETVVELIENGAYVNLKGMVSCLKVCALAHALGL